MNTELSDLIIAYKQTKWDALLRENMGDYHLKELKPHLDFIRHFLNVVIDNPHFNTSYQHYEESLLSILREFNSIKTTIRDYQDGGQKQPIIDAVIRYKQQVFGYLDPLFRMMQIQDQSAPDKRSKPLAQAIEEHHKATKKNEQQFNKLKQIESQLKSQYAEQTIRAESTRYGDFFKHEFKSNRFWSIVFGAALLVSIGGGFCIISEYLNIKQDAEITTIFSFIIKANLISKFFILSVFFVLISILKKEYFALRHQFALNRHRHNALSSHKEILNSIQKTANQSDKEISNAVLLELTKAMFSVQDTGYFTSQKDHSPSSKIVEISKSLVHNTKN